MTNLQVNMFAVLSLRFTAATFPDELGLSVPLVEEEQKDLLYVPLDGEWGCRMRSEECERIIKAIDQLCTLGMSSSSPCEITVNFCNISRDVRLSHKGTFLVKEQQQRDS